MNCRNIHKKLNAYVDAELPESMANKVRVHLEECPRCRRAFHLMISLNSRIERVPTPPDPAEDFTATVMKRISGLSVPEKQGRTRWVPSAVYAGLFAIFLLAGFLFLPHPVTKSNSGPTQSAWMEIMEEDAALHLSQLQDPEISSLWSEVHETAE